MDTNNVVVDPTEEEGFTEDMMQQVADELNLGAESNERVKKLRDILNGKAEYDDKEEIDPTILNLPDTNVDLFNEIEADQSNDVNLIDIAINGINANTISMEEISKSVSESIPDLDPTDIAAMLNVAKRYKDGEHFNVYDALPKKIQQGIMTQAVDSGLDKKQMNLFAKLFIEEFCSDIFNVTMEKEAIDFNQALQQALDIPDITQLYEDYIKDKMEVELMNKAKELEVDFPAGAEILRTCSTSFTESYKFTRQRAALTGKVRRKLYKDNAFYNRFCNEFNHANKNSKFKIPDIYEFGRVLDKLAPTIGITSDDVLALVILTAKTCINYNSSDTASATFMYYTLRNVMNIEHHRGVINNSSKPVFSDFDQEIINNIVSLVTEMRTISEERRGN